MHRNITNVIRYVMDEFIPPVIRDNKYFMYPLFYIAYRGKNVKKLMEFKSYAHKLTNEEYEQIYRELESIGNDRPTDLNKGCLDFMLENIPEDTDKVIDIGCGRGYFAKQLIARGFETWGCDVYESLDIPGLNYVQGNVENLPFEDNSFDVVTCSHTLEHVKDLPKAISELKRIAKKRVIISVPCQRYHYYTLDLHIHFFPYKEKLEEVMDMENYICRKIWGDLVYIGYIK